MDWLAPLYDGWSIDFWIVDNKGDWLLPSRQKKVHQKVAFNPNFVVQTKIKQLKKRLFLEAWIQIEDRSPLLTVKVEGLAFHGGWLIASIRPYNPEGISFIEDLSFNARQNAWQVNKTSFVALDRSPDKVRFSEFRKGDVFQYIFTKQKHNRDSVHCSLGLASGAALFNLGQDQVRSIRLSIPLGKELQRDFSDGYSIDGGKKTCCKAVLPDTHFQFLFKNAVHTLKMLSAGEIYPGPYTYKRFWFRDSCQMMQALLCLGEFSRVRRHLENFIQKQKKSGYFQSQEGEWDSNGQVLWILDKYQQMSGQTLPEAWIEPIHKAVRWIIAKRTPRKNGKRHAGLLPAGFSAEHLGPNDFYFWDDFWPIAGLKVSKIYF